MRSATACSGIACSRTVTSVITAERPLRADEQPGQVVAGRRLRCARARADHAPVGEHRLERQHVGAHLPVAHRRRAGRVRRRHPAERRIGARVDREEEAVLADGPLEREPGDARLHRRRQVLRARCRGSGRAARGRG